MEKTETFGCVVYAFGPLIHVRTESSVCCGGIVYVVVSSSLRLMGEVIAVDGKIAKAQMFEDTKGIRIGMQVVFITNQLLSAVLGPGLLGSVFDGLQNPLDALSSKDGMLLKRGRYINPLSTNHTWWKFHPLKTSGDIVVPGERLGYVLEHGMKHYIMVPFTLHGKWRIVKIISKSIDMKLDEVVAVITSMSNTDISENVYMYQSWPIKTPLTISSRIPAYQPLITGMRILDMCIPVIKGGSFCTPGPFGAGKTMLQYHLARYSDVDIVILIACGERAGEVVHFIKEFAEIKDDKTGKSLLERTVIICNTSSMPVAAREASVYLGVTLGEYFRQMGYNVLVLPDSTSRWAQALREISGKLEEIPGEEAYPPYLGSYIARLYERAGVINVLGTDQVGTLTIGGTVSPAGGNLEEPVTQATLAVVGTFIGLSKERADARKFPAIDPMISWSNNMEIIASSLGERLGEWFLSAVSISKQVIQQGSIIQQRIEVLGEDGISLEDLTLMLQANMYDFVFFQQNAFDADDQYSSFDKSHALLSIFLRIFNIKQFGKTVDETKSTASKLNFMMKNLCFVPLNSNDFIQQTKSIDTLITHLNNLNNSK